MELNAQKPTMTMKWCSVCKQYLPRDEFYKNRTTNDGLDKKCKHCAKQLAKVYEEKGKRSEWGREWRKNNPQKYLMSRLRTAKNLLEKNGYTVIPPGGGDS